MNWATERARRVLNSIGYRENPEAAIAEALQAVADECVEACETEEVLIPISEWETKKRLSAATATGLATVIRAKFPREEV